MIDAHTQLVGLIGWPIRHSLSPTMHNAAFDALSLNWRYVPLPVRPGEIEGALVGLSALNFRGANITIPYKEAVIPFVDTLSPEAQEIGAINTIVIRPDGMRIGHNTDSQGFIASLRHGGFEPRGRGAVVVGSGGGARAAVHGLLSAGIEKVSVLSRTLGHAQDLIAALPAAHLRAARLTVHALRKECEYADLLVNATPVGMWPNTNESIWPDGLSIPAHLTVFDLVYNPHQTRLLKQASASGALGISGLEMLIQQGARSFKLWTNRPAPIDVMREACVQYLTCQMEGER